MTTRAATAATRGKLGIVLVAVVDLLTLLLLLLVLYLCPPSGSITLTTSSTLSLYHFFGHGALILSAFIAFFVDVLFVPVWFGVLGLVAAAVDVYVLVTRAVSLFSTTLMDLELVCEFFLLGFDILLLLIALGYILYAIQTISAFAAIHQWEGAFLPVPREPQARYDEVSLVDNDDAQKTNYKTVVMDESATRRTADSAAQRRMALKFGATTAR